MLLNDSLGCSPLYSIKHILVSWLSHAGPQDFLSSRAFNAVARSLISASGGQQSNSILYSSNWQTLNA